MRSLRMRQWMIVGILTFMVVPTLAYQAVNLLDRHLLHPFPPWPPRREQLLNATLSDLAAGTAHWRETQWQRSFAASLTALGVAGRIRDPSGAEIIHAGPIGSGQQPNWQAITLQAGRSLGTIELFVPQPNDHPARLAALLALLLVLIHAGWQMGRNVVHPLEAMSRAARRVAKGNLDFELPSSRVREVAEARTALESMGTGLSISITQQAALEAERRFFIGAIAHDLRTPLFALRGYLVGLEQGLTTTPAQTAHYVAVCREKADQLDRLVSDLFAFTKLEYLEPALCRAPLDLGLLLHSVLDGLHAQAATKGVTLAINGPGAPCMTTGDEHLLRRAVENLLDNALRHTPAGGEIETCWCPEQDRVVFTIADTGPGITLTDMPYLFDPLYRGEVSRNRQTGGAGLGLAIARRALRAHGGDLIATNRLGGGAEFTAWLPLPAPLTI